MQITVGRDDILGPLGTVTNVVERRQTLPILSNVLLRSSGGQLKLTRTDLEVEVVATLSAGDGDFEATLPARKFFDICRAIPAGSVVTLSVQGEKVAIKAAKSRFSLLTLPVADFPSVTSSDLKQALTIKHVELKKLLDQTIFCIAQQDVRYYLNGLYLEFAKQRLRAVATDGHRMAISDIRADFDPSLEMQLIVPRKGVLEISRLLHGENMATLMVGRNHIRVETETLVLTSKLIDGRFPDYTKVIPHTVAKTIVLPRQLFREALSRVAILSNEKYRGVRLSVQKGKLSISAHNPEQEEAVEELETEYQGESLEIGFNVSYLIEAVGSIDADAVTIGLNDPNTSCVIYAADTPSTKYILMPMRL